MSRHNPDATTVSMPAALQPSTLRAGLTLAVVAAFAAYAVRIQAQSPVTAQQNAAVTDSPVHNDLPFPVGMTAGY